MSHADDKHLLLAAFVDELGRCGLRDACTSPGSRNTPLLLALVRERRLRCHSHIDERCAGFFALGLAKATGVPVAIAVTSGTAVAELLPAAIEAREARVPLLLLSADRPAELREVGAGQTIDQTKIFGSAAKWFFDVDLEGAGRDGARWIRTLACRAFATALEGRPGVVHLNFPLREPLVSSERLPADDSGRRDGMPYVDRSPLGGSAALRASTPLSASTALRASAGLRASTALSPNAGPEMLALRQLLAEARRGVLVAGREEAGRPARDCDRSLAAAAAAFCETNGWPLLADPLSGARRGEGAIAHYDALLRDERFAAEHRPDLVLRVGDLPTSKPLRTWLAQLRDVPQVALDPHGAWQDPASVLSRSLAIQPACALWELTPDFRGTGERVDDSAADRDRIGRLGAEDDWLPRWRAADMRASEAIGATLARCEISEPAVAAELGTLLPEEATLFVASSMPVRDIETFWPVRGDPPRVLCNRGANGIDGTVSSAFGVAAAGDGPVVLLIGDVALAHDIGGLIAARRLRLDLTIVLLNNSGGGIFDFLPIAAAPAAREADPTADNASRTAGRANPSVSHADPTIGQTDIYADPTIGQTDIYTRHVATPPDLDFALAASLYGLSHEHVHDIPAFRVALERALESPGGTIVEVSGEREGNVRLHRAVWEAVAGSLA